MMVFFIEPVGTSAFTIIYCVKINAIINATAISLIMLKASSTKGLSFGFCLFNDDFLFVFFYYIHYYNKKHFIHYYCNEGS